MARVSLGANEDGTWPTQRVDHDFDVLSEPDWRIARQETQSTEAGGCMWEM